MRFVWLKIARKEFAEVARDGRFRWAFGAHPPLHLSRRALGEHHRAVHGAAGWVAGAGIDLRTEWPDGVTAVPASRLNLECDLSPRTRKPGTPRLFHTTPMKIEETEI